MALLQPDNRAPGPMGGIGRSGSAFVLVSAIMLIRKATVANLTTIMRHRKGMFYDMGFCDKASAGPTMRI